MVQQDDRRTDGGNITALYCRLSQEDEYAGESGSIQHQKQILMEYANANSFPNPQFFVDDGYSGVTFDRPGYKAMMEQVEAGNVSTILVKDHSRLGRNRLVVGILLEETFASYNVRYIAINDNVDTLNGVGNASAQRRLTAIKKTRKAVNRLFPMRTPRLWCGEFLPCAPADLALTKLHGY